MSGLSVSEIFLLLWPFREGGSGLVMVFVAIIMAYTLGTLVLLRFRAIGAARDISNASGLLEDVDARNLLAMRSTIRQRAEQLAVARGVSRAGNRWIEFDETLVVSGDTLRNTEPAEDHFGAEQFARDVLENRVLHAAPSILTALGLLGTFIGLAVGLSNLEFGADASVEEIRGGLAPLILGASVGFTSSVWGIFCSVAVNLIIRFTEAHLSRKAGKFVQRIDSLFVHQSSEQALVRIEEHTSAGTAALEELHEKIGARLQEAVQGLSTEMQNAVSRAINSSMRPAMEQIAEHSMTQSTEVFRQLVTEFSTSFSAIGDQQADQLAQASDAIRSSISEMSTAVSQSVTGVVEAVNVQRAEAEAQGEAFRMQLAELSELTRTLALRIDSAADRMANGATALSAAGENLEASAKALAGTREELEGTLTAVGEALDGTAEAHKQAAELLQTHTSELVRLHDSSQALSTSVTDAATHVNDGFRGLGAQQEQFLDGLAQRIGRLERSMDTHLEEYEAKVRQQIGERMEDWNRHSRDYASYMLKTSESLSAVLDELEVKTNGAPTSS